MNKTKWKEMKTQNTKMKIMEGQNESTWTPKEPKMKDQKAKMKAHEGPKSQNERKWRIKRPKWKEMKAQKGKHESKWSPRRPKWKEMKAQRAQNRVSLGVAYLDPISKMAHKMFKITELAAAAFKSEMRSHDRSCSYMSYLYGVLIATQVANTVYLYLFFLFSKTSV